MARITVRQASRVGGYAKPWVARILGSHPSYKLDRLFLEPIEKSFGATWVFEIEEDGLYEICDRNSKGKKHVSFALMVGGVLQQYISEEIFNEHVTALDGAKAAREATVKGAQAKSTAERHAEHAARIASDPIANAQAATELAAEKADRQRINKDTWLPYVRAAMTFWSRIQGRALADDNTRASFEAMGQQLQFAEEFRKLTGRDFDLLKDEVTYAEIQSL